jgi:hypothetical protein
LTALIFLRFIMNNKKLIPLLLTSFFAATPAHAASVVPAIDLIAIGTISGTIGDLSTKTAGALENAIAGNRLGGIGSGMAYAGGNTFIATPDRGPNAVSYNSAVDDTASYIDRFQTFTLSLVANPDYNAGTVGSLPYTLTPNLTATTLLSSPTPLVYGLPANGLPDGTPALNRAGYNYFTGRSDNFDAGHLSTYNRDARFDPEGVRVANDGKSVFISDEYGPYVYQFNRNTGRRIKTFTLPAKFAIANLNSVGATEISGNTSGRITNKGMEGLAITPDGTTLVGMMQQNLIQDAKKFLRIATIDIASGLTTHEYAYKLTNGSSVCEIVALSNTEFLILERDGEGLGASTAAVASTAVVKQLFYINLATATDISGINLVAASAAGVTPVVVASPTVTKTLWLDMVTKLTAAGILAKDIPSKLESVTFGPDITISGVPKHTLFVANDNDFVPTVIDANHSSPGKDNPNNFYVFAFNTSAWPSFAPQTVSSFTRDAHYGR